MGNWSIEDYSIGDRKLYIKLKIGGKNVQVLSFGKNV